MGSFQLPASTVLLLMLVGALLANQVQLRSELREHREEHRQVLEAHREEYTRMQEEHGSKYRRMQDELEGLREELELDNSGKADDDVNGTIPIRRLFGTHSVSTSASTSSGCFSLSADVTLTLSQKDCPNSGGGDTGERCPACFINTGTGGVTLTLNNAGTSLFKASAFSGVRQYMFINSGSATADTFTIRTTVNGNRDYIIAPYSTATAMIVESNNYLMWQSNYGIVGTNAGTAVCPDGCNGGTIYKSSDGGTFTGTNNNL
jgi:hypothetical protein